MLLFFDNHIQVLRFEPLPEGIRHHVLRGVAAAARSCVGKFTKCSFLTPRLVLALGHHKKEQVKFLATLLALPTHLAVFYSMHLPLTPEAAYPTQQFGF